MISDFIMRLVRSILFGDNLAGELTSRLAQGIAGAIVTVFLARSLSVSEYGNLYLVISILSIVVFLCHLGIGQSTAKFIAENINSDNKSVSEYCISGIKLFLISTLVTFSAYIALIDTIGEFFGDNISPYLYVGSAYVLSMALLKFSRKIYQGYNDIGYVVAIRNLYTFFKLFLIIGLVSVGYGGIGALYGYSIASTIAGLTGMVLITYRVRTTIFESLDNKRAIWINNKDKLIFDYSVPLTFTTGSTFIMSRIDIALIGYFLSSTQVGYYTIAKQVAEFAQKPGDALGFTVGPESAQLGTEDLADKIYESLLLSTHFYIACCLGIIVVSSDLILLLFGEEYTGGSRVLQIFAVYIIFNSITSITSPVLDFLGYAKIRAYIKGSCAFLNLILNVILIPVIGIVGAAASTLLVYVIYSVANSYILNKESGFIDELKIRDVGILMTINLIMVTVAYWLLHTIDGPLSLLFSITLSILLWIVLSEHFLNIGLYTYLN